MVEAAQIGIEKHIELTTQNLSVEREGLAQVVGRYHPVINPYDRCRRAGHNYPLLL